MPFAAIKRSRQRSGPTLFADPLLHQVGAIAIRLEAIASRRLLHEVWFRS